ncbi:MAG: rod shape-determining protein MreC, partial [Mycobacteriales bacterium]
GDVLLTTGSGTYAAGVPIGTVTTVTPDTNAITRSATIVPFVDVASLDLVGVITDSQRTAPRVPLRPVVPRTTASPCAAAVPQGPVPTALPAPPKPRPMPTPSVTVTPTPTRTP